MFAAILALASSVVELLIFLGVTIVVYQVFLSDWVKAWRAQNAEKHSKYSNIEKIALVKLVSEDPKDIEQFITNNATYLSDATVQKLVARIEAIHTDKIISADDILKTRFEDLEVKHQQQAEAEAEEEAHAKTARS
jgi:hypothetical protein